MSKDKNKIQSSAITRRTLCIVSGDLFAGKERQFILQVKALKQLGVPVHALVFNEGQLADLLRSSEIKVDVIHERKGLFNLFRKSLQIAKDISPQFIITHEYKEHILAYLIKKAGKSRHICYIHGGFERYGGLRALKFAIYTKFTHLACRKADAIVVVANHLAKLYKLENHKTLTRIPNAIEVRSTSKPSELSGTFSVVGAGRLWPMKRFDLLVEAIFSN